MELSKKQLKAVKKLSYNLTRPSEIAAIIEVDADAFIKQVFTTDSPVYKKLYAGLLKREIDIKQKFNGNVFADILQLELKQIKDYKSHLIILRNAKNL